jgi:hypothetical protein
MPGVRVLWVSIESCLMKRPLILLVLVLICFAYASSFAQSIVRQRTRTRATQITTGSTRLVVAAAVDHLDVVAREPSIVEHPDGTLFVAGYGEPLPTLWKSRDRGATWVRVNVGTEADGAIGNSDVDLAVAPDGTLYFVTMGFDRKALEGIQISIGVSRDVGATWSWTLLSKTRFDDRPWVDVAPDGTAHVIWNDGRGICHAVSNDRGRTWSERPRIHSSGGSSHLAVGPNGEVAVRITPFSSSLIKSGEKVDEAVDLIAVSTDRGRSWRKHPAPGHRDWGRAVFEAFPYALHNKLPPPRYVETLAWDARGALYSVWTNREGLWVGRSFDHGDTWATWNVAAESDVRYFPFLVARERGELAVAWFSGHGETLEAHVARIDVARGNAAPRLIESPPMRPDSWGGGRAADDPQYRDTAGEYLGLTFLSDGGLALVSPIQNRRAQRFGFSFWKIDER